MPDDSMDALMQKAYAKVRGEMPDVQPVSVTSSDASMLGGYMMPKGANAATNPFTGNVSYNPAMLQGRSPHDLEDTMTHELTHARQAQSTPWWQTALDLFRPDAKVPQGITPGSTLDNPYLWRPNEMEAFQAERDRNRLAPYPTDPMLGTRDIQLRKDR